MTQFILINLKTYSECIGIETLKLAKYCSKISKIYGFEIGIAPQYPDIYRVTSNLNIPVYSQHVDNIDFGNNTGHISIDCIKEAGACGSLLNHSEFPISINNLVDTIEKLRNRNLKSIVCTSNIKITMSISNLNPNYIAIEPPELIGSGNSISKLNPKLISELANYFNLSEHKKTKLLCGAGISTSEDIQTALDLGANGVLISSIITKSIDKYKTLEDLVCHLK